MNKNLYAPTVRVRFDGYSRDLNVVQLGLPANATDFAIKNAVARNFDVSVLALHAHVIERSPNGNIFVHEKDALN